MINKKFTILLASLLLAVGWTTSASAQRLPMPKSFMTQHDFKKTKQTNVSTNSMHSNAESALDKGVYASEPIDGVSGKSNAPHRANYTEVADAVHPKSYYDQWMYYWYDEGENEKTAMFTSPAKNPYQIWSLLRVIYASDIFPGIRYSKPYDAGITSASVDLPYDGVDFGWYISGDIAEDVTIDMNGGVNLQYVNFYDAAGNYITGYDARNTTLSNLPDGWTRNTANNGFTYYLQRNSSGYLYWRDDFGLGYEYYATALTISKDLFKDKGSVTVKLSARRTSAEPNNFTAPYSNYPDFYRTYQHRWVAVNAGKGGRDFILPYNSWSEFQTILHGPVTPPSENGYTVLLVKLKDTDENGNLINNDVTVRAPEYTYSYDDLIDYIDTYIDEVQLLTDGMRVGQEINGQLVDGGTLFSYSGTLNRFFFISKGKMATIGSAENQIGWYSYNIGNYTLYHQELIADRAPFYAMYEEFSPETQDSQTGHDDFYAAMVNGESFPIIHDCNSVNYMQHYFSMTGKNGTDPKSMSSLIFYIPDYRGTSNTDETWRDYDSNNQPRVGLYTIQLNADAAPTPNVAETYTITVDWASSLNGIVDNQVSQTYDLYEVIYDENGNIIEYKFIGTYVDITTYTTQVQQQDISQTKYYIVKGHPTGATNPDQFYTWSNIDDVTIPGLFDFLKLEKDHVESDFDVTGQKNYYRNYLYPTNLAPNTGMTMEQLKQEWPEDQIAKYTLYRDNTGIAVLEVRAVGKKVYYRIKYYRDTQETDGLNVIPGLNIQYVDQNN